MKANELMIGDWVSYNGKPCRITGIMPPYNVYISDHFPLAVVLAERCEPIPLTEEILEKNGFDYDEIDEEWHHKKCPLILFNPWNNDGAFVLSTYNSITFNHVHQLQHVLRLCGLNELADNFKV